MFARTIPALLLAALPLCLPAGGPPAALGPENHGLRLGFAIQDDDPTDPTVILHYTLTNAGKEPVTLVADWSWEPPSPVYADWLKERASYMTIPEIPRGTAQTMCSPRKSPQPTVTLAPGQTITTTRECKETWLGSPITYTSFPADGVYTVMAEFPAKTDGGEIFQLLSNPATHRVGNSDALPKHATARLLHVDPKAGTVIIDLGSYHRIEPGDRFRTMHTLGSGWILTVEKTELYRATCRVETYKPTPDDQFSPLPAMPEAGRTAALERRQ